MSESKTSTPTVLLMRPPDAVELESPLFANQVRVAGAADSLVIHAYYLSGTATLGDNALITEELGDEGTRRIRVIAPPVARVALPLTTALELAFLLIDNVKKGTPDVLAFQRHMLGRLAELTCSGKEASETTNESDGDGK